MKENEGLLIELDTFHVRVYLLLTIGINFKVT